LHACFAFGTINGWTKGARAVSTDVNVKGEDRIGRYRYVRTLLQGQNSTVMEVVEDGTGRRFAMKQLLPNRATDKDERKAFEFEAKLGMDLRHPNLIHVHDYVKDKTQPYFVMDYFPSTHMRLIIGKGALYDENKSKLRRVLEQAALGLAYMHDKGWVHRDIKPENIIINKTGEARLIDYALALKIKTGMGKFFSAKPPRQGTHSYMSPEQIRCEPSSPQADIYSFGIVCYEFACRRQPFRANSPTELLNKHLREPPPPMSIYNKEITQEYADLVMKMLRKKPAERPKSMHELMSLLKRVRIFKDDPSPMAGRDLM
jgi:serine/threonine protein kinase